MTLGDPPTMSPTISGRIQFCEGNFIFVCWVFIFLAFHIQDLICFEKLLDLASNDIIGIYQMAYCCHQLVYVALVRVCGHL